MANNLVHQSTVGIGQLLSILTEIHDDVDEAKALVNLLGWELPPGVEDIGLATIDTRDFLEKLDVVLGSTESELDNEILMLGRIAELTESINVLVHTIRELASALPTELASFGDYVDRTNIHKELPKRLFDFLISNYLSTKSPIGFAILHLINVIDYRHFDADPDNFQIEHVRAIINFHHFKTVFDDPAMLAKEAYGWGTPDFSAFILLRRLNMLFQAIGLRARLVPLDQRAEEVWLGGSVSDPEPMPQLITFLHDERGAVAGFRLGFSVVGVRPTTRGASDGGLGLVPIVRGQGQGSIPFFGIDDTFIDTSAEVELLKRIALLLRPDQDLELKVAESFNDTISGRFALGLRHGGPVSDVKTLLSLPGGTALQIQQAHLIGGMEKFSNRPAESFLELGIFGGRFVFNMDKADSFVKKSISQKEVETPFDIRVGWTKDQGIYFAGSAGLNLTIPVHSEIGPFSLNSLTIGLAVESGGLEIQSTIAGSLALGPLLASVEGLGVKVDVAFNEGNMGLFGLYPAFKPPTGVGLTLDGGGFKGGGFLRFEPDEARYVGILELEFQDKIALKAIGLLTTRLPGGASGFSLLVLITAEFNPIQLGYGFTLNGVGGLLGLNRTMRIERLRTGVRDNTLSSILFPPDPVANASRIISDLRQVFPPQSGRFVFGPMGKIGWGTPTLITLDVGLALEVPEPVTLALLGVLKAQLPDEERPLLKLQVNFLGVLDFQKEQLSFDATIYDSKLLSFPLAGDMAVRLNWGDDPNFLLTVGGFHPAYQPPALALPPLTRITVQLLSGKNPRLTLESYFAITSNTVQFGAKIELYAGAGSFNVYGLLAFDTLFQFSPFYFVAEITAMLALRRGSKSLASISLALTLEGTTPWKAKGTATLKLCWFIKVKVRFNKTFGREVDTRLDDLNVFPLLTKALQAPGNWEAQLPPRRHLLVSLKDMDMAGQTIVAHPFGVLTVSQKVVPLNVRIDTVGHQRPRDGHEFRITTVTVNGHTHAPSPVKESFAPAQFFQKSDEEKLASHSFEQYDSGIRLSDTEALESDHVVLRGVDYELSYLDSQRDDLLRTPIRFVPYGKGFHTWTAGGSIAKSPLSRRRTRTSALAPRPVRVGQEAFAVVTVDELAPAAEAHVRASEAEALAYMQELIAHTPSLAGRLQTVPAFELN